MRSIVAGVGALLGLLVCDSVAPAAIAGGASPLSSAELLGRQGFIQESIRGGDVRENAPDILARRRRRRRKKKRSSGSYVSGGGGSAIQVDPNTADVKKLMMLPLLSRDEAEAIIEYRKKDRIDTHEEILEIDGVKPSHYRIFKHLIVIREEASGELGSATAASQLY
jgi:hypothetical protein